MERLYVQQAQGQEGGGGGGEGGRGLQQQLELEYTLYDNNDWPLSAP